jgi:hypothetical protein
MDSQKTLPTPALLSYLRKVRPYVGDRYLPDSFAEEITAISGLADLARIDRDESHPLWWFLSPIAQDLFGDASAVPEEKPGVPILSSFAVIPPPFANLRDRLKAELEALSLKVTVSERDFTGRLVGLFYGGFPWFEPYVRVCEAKGYLGQNCCILAVHSKDEDVVRKLRIFKGDNRDRYASPVRMAFDDLPYPGLIRPFHTPSRLENRRHVRAIREA